MKAFIIRLIATLFFASLSCLLLWQYYTNCIEPLNVSADVKQTPASSNVAALSGPQDVKKNPPSSNGAAVSDPHKVKQIPANSKDNAIIDKPLANFPSTWKKQEKNINSFSVAALSSPQDVKKNPPSSNGAAVSDPHKVKQIPANSNGAAASDPHKVQQNPANSKENAIIAKLLANYTSTWKKQEKNINSFRSLLGSSCNAISNAVVTQENSPVGTNITYDGEQKRIKVVTPALFGVFPKETPFKKAPWDTCAVVGNGGILANSSCGKQIDSATFVIRCNLPPLNNGHERDTGRKSNLVTANPSIFFQKYESLHERRRPFMEDMQLYGDALLLLPAFSFGQSTAVSFRVFYSLEDFNSSTRAVFFNPKYLKSLAGFWRGQGVREARLSTGIMMASLAVELCNNVHLYGFWPFGTHPFTRQQLNNHYYDNRPANSRMHAMPSEFEALLKLHNKGVIHLHLGECAN